MTEEGKDAGRLLIKKEKSTVAKNKSLQNTSTGSKGTIFVILKNHSSTSVRNERLNPTSKARREDSRNEFVEKRGVPDRVKSFREVVCSENRPRAWPRFPKPIRNRLRKIKNVIRSRPSKAETGLAGKENRVQLWKEE